MQRSPSFSHSSAPAIPAFSKRRLAFLYLSGGALFLSGLFLWSANALHFYRSAPITGYLAMALGAMLWRLADRFLLPRA